MQACCCGRRSGTFPESRGRSAPSWALLFAALSLLAGCSREARAVRLPSDPGTEVYRITCKSAVEPCREKATALCGGRYEVLQNAGAPVEPPRVSSAPGPRSTGSRYQRPDWVGELVIACGSARHLEPAAAPAISAAATSAAEPAERVPTPDQLCVPGATQLCLGPAACRGAQACLPNGRGWGPCDCGNNTQSDAGTGAH